MLDKFRNLFASSDLTIVVRASGERTQNLCCELLRQESTGNNVFITEENSFSSALRKSFSIGIKQQKKWTLMVDADVLARPRVIKDLLVRAENSPGEISIFQTSMLDKFFGGIRVGGMKLYRSEVLPMALELVPEISHRPEAHVIKALHKKNTYVDITDIVCGLHDFEQYYSDIFRKGFTHGIKHASLVQLLLPYWKRMGVKDRDFAVLIDGLAVGLRHKDDLQLSKSEVASEFHRYIVSSGVEEKSPLRKEDFDLSNVAGVLKNFKAPREYAKIKREMDRMGRPEIPRSVYKQAS